MMKRLPSRFSPIPRPKNTVVFARVTCKFPPLLMRDNRIASKPMTDLERLRHSTAHVLATAILRIWPEAQFAAGPPVENGFYYDLELDQRITPEDFTRIEAEMSKVIDENQPFER